jgi:hypothetical protein
MALESTSTGPIERCHIVQSIQFNGDDHRQRPGGEQVGRTRVLLR